MGILTGAAIAVGLLIVTLGIPRFATEPAVPAMPVEPPTEMLPVPSSGMAEVPQAEPATDAPQKAAETTSSNLPEPEEGPSAAPPNAATEAVTPQAEPSPADEAGWFAFWSPFRSEIAAAGFVAELQRTTGLDYRVVKLKPGVYEVAFAYSDKNDIQDKLLRISTATGLELGGG
jgi:hypothetical protein